MTAINMHDDVFDHVSQFQFYQEKKGEIAFRFVPKETCTDEIVARMRQRLMVKLGDDAKLEMRPVREIPLSSRGKHRFIVQKLRLEFQEGWGPSGEDILSQ
jgi:phenylacetate-CoA ligase